MRCRFPGCAHGLLLTHTSEGVKGGDVLRFSCGHISRVYPHHANPALGALRCIWCGAFLPTFAEERIQGHRAGICGRPECSDMDDWLEGADDEAQVILDAAQALVDEIAREAIQNPPPSPDYLLAVLGPSEAPESPPEPSPAPVPILTRPEPPEGSEGPPRHTTHRRGYGHRCEASTAKGLPCSNYAQQGSLFCGVHRQAWEAVE